jgi:hypothetical protein
MHACHIRGVGLINLSSLVHWHANTYCLLCGVLKNARSPAHSYGLRCDSVKTASPSAGRCSAEYVRGVDNMTLFATTDDYILGGSASNQNSLAISVQVLAETSDKA